jgi:predicted enzyme related to lactoylglutathione lyase
MKIKYAHTNIISKDWRGLAEFYEKVFECKLLLPERKLSGDWLEKGTAIKKAALEGAHLRLPGYGDSGPTLEIFQYSENIDKASPVQANREGFGHIAFQVDDLEVLCQRVVNHGGKLLGEITSKEIEAVGKLSFIYVTDPENNIVEIQAWTY